MHELFTFFYNVYLFMHKLQYAQTFKMRLKCIYCLCYFAVQQQYWFKGPITDVISDLGLKAQHQCDIKGDK